MRKLRWLFFLVGLCLVLSLGGCLWIEDLKTPSYWKPMPTPVSETPTPHYTALTGKAYVIAADQDAPLLAEPSYVGQVLGNIATGTEVEILEAVWYYAQNKFSEN